MEKQDWRSRRTSQNKRPDIWYLVGSPYFVLNCLCLLVYPCARYFYGMRQRAVGVLSESLFGRDRESAILSLLGVYLAMKLYQSSTWELFFSFFFMYGKLAFIFLFFLSRNTSLAIYYTLLCFVLWLSLSHPKYSGPSKMVKVRSMDQLEELTNTPLDELIRTARSTNTATKKQNKNFATVQSTMLVFTANWADNSYFTYPMWVRFANRFSTKKIRFIEIDCGRFETLARAFKVSTNVTANQLPSLILLEDGAEYLRFPPVDVKSGQAGRVINYKERELIKYFDLENRFLSTREVGSAKESGAESKTKRRH